MAKIEFIHSLQIADFPSGSSLNFHENKFYLIGDDSKNILVLDINYTKIDSVRLFEHSENRIPKIDKMDLEGSAILNTGDKNQLLILGSASRKNRKRIILIPFSNTGLDFTTLEHSIYKTKDFIKRIKSNGIEEINLEGVCFLLDNKLVLANRGNRASQNNHLIITDTNFWEHQDEANLVIRKLVMPAAYDGQMIGISELCYIKERDVLLITLTSESTANAFDDGEIGDSFIGIIKNASNSLHQDDVIVDELLNLSDVSAGFQKEKIEGICAEVVAGDHIILHLASDNDSGETKLFKIKMIL